MSWKPIRRTLHNVPKVKLTLGRPLLESVGDATPVNEELMVTGQTHTWNLKNDSFTGCLSSLPVASQAVEKNYLAKFDKSPEFEHGDDAEIEQLFFSDLGGTDGSTLDNSSASFLSWADEVEQQGAAKTRALFEELEVALYDEGSPVMKDQEISSECIAWKNSHIHLRVLGQTVSSTQQLSDEFRELEDKTKGVVEDEVIARHGFIEHSPNAESSTESDGARSVISTVHSGNLIEKVKTAVLEQLTFYALSEALKSFEQEQQIGHVNVRQNIPFPEEEACLALANLNEDLGRALQISGRSIHRSPKLMSIDFGKKFSHPSSPERIQFGIHSKRFLSSIDAIPEDKISVDNSFSVLGIPKPLNSEIFISKTKALEKRCFHSAADRKRPGVLNRRFSCISPEHDRLLKPLGETEECVRHSSGDFRDVVKSKQISAPNTPLKLLRHLTLPPIQNLNSYTKLSVNSQEKPQASLTHIRRIFVKNKVSLSPLPNAVNMSEGGLTELQVSKQMLDSTPDSGRWSSCRKLGFSSIQNMKPRKKSIERNTNNV